MPAGPKLRAPRLPQPLEIALIEPEIPPNTGAVARTCAATGSPLHLVGKLGFRIDEQSVRRAGLDYWHLVDLRRHESIDDFLASPHQGARYYFTGRAERSYLDVRYQPGDQLIFGKESVGLDEELLRAHPDQLVAIPTIGEVRSLNLSNAVAIVLYEALRQLGAFEARGLELR